MRGAAQVDWLGEPAMWTRAAEMGKVAAMSASAAAARPDRMRGNRMPGGVTYWLQGEPVQNLGDFLTELFLARLGTPARQPSQRVRLIGSVISEAVIRMDLRAAGTPGDASAAYWGCGQRDENGIPARLRARCRFHGVRGPLTRSRLALPETTPIGDPALLLPLLHEPELLPNLAGRTICVPHFYDRASDARILEQSGADFVVRPQLPASLDALLKMIDVICSAEFVLAGALHAAIIACAYRRPFAFYIEDYIDLPFKWLDFAASVHIPAVFARNVPEGSRAWATLLAPALRRPLLLPILAAFPGVLHSGLLDKAKSWDLHHG